MTSEQMTEAELVSDEVRGFFDDIPKGEMYLAEADFGLRQITPYLEKLPDRARVLEVGSGPCIALSTIATTYPHLHVEGIEPMGDGFAFFDSFIAKIKALSPGVKIHRHGYETFESDRGWDLVFLVNVFEHLPDWRDFLTFVDGILSDGGRCVILCPNYGFPYESHFSLPIIGNKAMTERVFSKRIEQYERDENCLGLYDSLNFVKLRQVRRALNGTGLKLKVHVSIVKEMVDRLDTDPDFARRQKAIAGLARLMKRSGLLDGMLGMTMFQNMLPYMKLELTR